MHHGRSAQMALPTSKGFKKQTIAWARAFSRSHRTALRQLNEVSVLDKAWAQAQRASDLASPGLSRVSSKTQETSSHLREPLWVAFVMPCSLDGHTWATQSTCIDLLPKMGHLECLYDSIERGWGRQCKMLQQQPPNPRPGYPLPDLLLQQHGTTQASWQSPGTEVIFHTSVAVILIEVSQLAYRSPNCGSQ